MKKEFGILCHITCLPSNYGIGDFGKSCFDFINFLHEQKIDVWQILPLNPTNIHNCPYGSMCSIAIDEMFVDVEYLVKLGLIKNKELKTLKKLAKTKKINYSLIKKEKIRIFNIAYNNINNNDITELESFAKNNNDIFDYAYYKVLLEKYSTTDWRTTPNTLWDLTNPEAKSFINNNKKSIFKYVFYQFILFKQWLKVKNYANSKNIKILGDIPISLEITSFDVFMNPQNFKLNKEYKPKVTAGVPGDAFNSKGQNWSTCVYNWKNLKKSNYKYLTNKIYNSTKLYDIVRLDHYAGYVEHFEIPNNNIIKGKWIKEGGEEFFRELNRNINLKTQVIIEDLGNITEECENVKKMFNLKGMNILHFAFDEENSKYLPKNVNKNSVYYLGTHDNNTTIGFLKQLTNSQLKNVSKLTPINTSYKNICVNLIKQMLNSKSKTVIVQIQDMLMQDERYRINIPGQARGCWEYKMPKNYKKQFIKTLNQIKK